MIEAALQIKSRNVMRTVLALASWDIFGDSLPGLLFSTLKKWLKAYLVSSQPLHNGI